MTVKYDDREAIAHGKITEKPLRSQPKIPTWAIKMTMGVTGLIFAAFILVHMAGNMKIFLPDHADGVKAIDNYAEFLREIGEPLFPRESILWMIRIVLIVCLVAHIYGGFAIHGRAKRSRGKFRRTNLMGGWSSFATRTMIITGVVLFCFIVFHILDLTMGVTPAASTQFEHGAAYANIVASFSRWPVALFYVIAQLLLFVHLTHGIHVAASDLGVVGKRWRQVFIYLAWIIPACILVGNIVVPIFVLVGWIA